MSTANELVYQLKRITDSTETRYSFDFRAFEIAGVSTVGVALYDSSGLVKVLKEPGDYRVEGVNLISEGGVVRLSTPPASGATHVMIMSAVPYQQTASFPNGSPVNPLQLEKSLDWLEMQILQLKELLLRAATVSINMATGLPYKINIDHITDEHLYMAKTDPATGVQHVTDSGYTVKDLQNLLTQTQQAATNAQTSNSQAQTAAANSANSAGQAQTSATDAKNTLAQVQPAVSNGLLQIGTASTNAQTAINAQRQEVIKNITDQKTDALTAIGASKTDALNQLQAALQRHLTDMQAAADIIKKNAELFLKHLSPGIMEGIRATINPTNPMGVDISAGTALILVSTPQNSPHGFLTDTMAFPGGTVVLVHGSGPDATHAYIYVDNDKTIKWHHGYPTPEQIKSRVYVAEAEIGPNGIEALRPMHRETTHLIGQVQEILDGILPKTDALVTFSGSLPEFKVSPGYFRAVGVEDDTNTIIQNTVQIHNDPYTPTVPIFPADIKYIDINGDIFESPQTVPAPFTVIDGSKLYYGTGTPVTHGKFGLYYVTLTFDGTVHLVMASEEFDQPADCLDALRKWKLPANIEGLDAKIGILIMTPGNFNDPNEWKSKHYFYPLDVILATATAMIAIGAGGGGNSPITNALQVFSVTDAKTLSNSPTAVDQFLGITNTAAPGSPVVLTPTWKQLRINAGNVSTLIPVPASAGQTPVSVVDANSPTGFSYNLQNFPKVDTTGATAGQVLSAVTDGAGGVKLGFVNPLSDDAAHSSIYSTGLIDPVKVSIDASGTSLTVGAIKAVYKDPTNQKRYMINLPSQTYNLKVTTGTDTYLYIKFDKNNPGAAALDDTATEPSETVKKDNIYIADIVLAGGKAIAVLYIGTVVRDLAFQNMVLSENDDQLFGIRIAGNSGAQTMAITQKGFMRAYGAGDPSKNEYFVREISPINPMVFDIIYYTKTITPLLNQTNIQVTQIENVSAGTVANAVNNDFLIYTIMFSKEDPGGTGKARIFLLCPQTTKFTSVSDAKSRISTYREALKINPELQDRILIWGYLIVAANATDYSNPVQATFMPDYGILTGPGSIATHSIKSDLTGAKAGDVLMINTAGDGVVAGTAPVFPSTTGATDGDFLVKEGNNLVLKHPADLVVKPAVGDGYTVSCVYINNKTVVNTVNCTVAATKITLTGWVPGKSCFIYTNIIDYITDGGIGNVGQGPLNDQGVMTLLHNVTEVPLGPFTPTGNYFLTIEWIK